MKTKKATQLIKFDASEELRSEDDIALYLELAFEEDPGDGSLIRAAIGDIAKARGMTEVAESAGLSRASLYKALSEDGNPEFATILKVFKALGLSLKPEHSHQAV